MAARKRSASRAGRPTKETVQRRRKRGILPGRREGGSRNGSPDATRQLFMRLRRTELALVYSMTGKPKDFSLDRYVDSVLQLAQDAKTRSGRDSDQRGAVQVPQERTAPGEGPGASGADWGPESWHGVEETESPPEPKDDP